MTTMYGVYLFYVDKMSLSETRKETNLETELLFAKMNIFTTIYNIALAMYNLCILYACTFHGNKI